MPAGFWLVPFAYLCGSLSSAILVCRLFRRGDPRDVGSGNPGATNVLRHAGRLAAALTLAGDAAKGFVPVALGAALDVSSTTLAATALAAFLGHLYPIFFGFKGGKGVATYIGVLLGLSWPTAFGFCAVWLAVAMTMRYSSLAALCAAASTPAMALALHLPTPVVLGMTGMVLLVLWRHRTNIRNLLEGREGKIGAR